MTSHAYNPRHNSLVSDENSTPGTSELIMNLDRKLLLRFEKKKKPQRLRNKINNLEKKSTSLAENSNSIGQYG